MKYDGRRYDVVVEGMPQWHCSHCQVAVTDGDSDTVLQDCLRRHIGLLTAAEIRDGRTALGLTQTDLANLLGCAAESVSRWECGGILQSRTYDRFLRVVFQLPVVRRALGAITNGSPLGRHAVLDATDPSASVIEAMKALTRIWEGAAPCIESSPKPSAPTPSADRAKRGNAAVRVWMEARKARGAMAESWMGAHSGHPLKETPEGGAPWPEAHR
jgi:DNA-binding transcriptional regulator YiaG